MRCAKRCVPLSAHVVEGLNDFTLGDVRIEVVVGLRRVDGFLSSYRRQMRSTGVVLALGHESAFVVSIRDFAVPPTSPLSSSREPMTSCGSTPSRKATWACPGAPLSDQEIIGAGGVGFAVAEFLVGDETESLDPKAFRSEWSIDDTGVHAGGLLDTRRRHNVDAPKHEITLMQRKNERTGRSLGKSTGWIHKARLAHAGIQELVGVTYDRSTTRAYTYRLTGNAESSMLTRLSCAQVRRASAPFTTRWSTQVRRRYSSAARTLQLNLTRS